MTLGQYLAMLNAGGQYEPMPSPPQGQTNINWVDIAGQGQPPLPDPTKSYSFAPVDVVASRLPELPPEVAQPEIMDPGFRDLYGGGGMPQAQTAAVPRPSMAFAPPPSSMSTPMPPLPIKGAPKAKSEDQAVVSSRPPAGQRDVPVPAIPAGQDVAMLEAPTAEPAAAEEPKPAPIPWQVGQPFQVTLGKTTYTVQNYNAGKNDQGVPTITSPVITLSDDKGTQYSYRRGVAPTIFEQAEKTMQQKLEESRQMMPKDGFTSYVVINGQQIPAMVQPDEQGISRIYYQAPDMPAPAEVPNIGRLQEGVTFISPPDQPNMLETIKQSRRNFVDPMIKLAGGISGGIQSQLTADEIATRLTPVIGPNPTQEEIEAGVIVPTVTFNFTTDTGDLISIDDAVKRGLVSPQVLARLTESADRVRADMTQAALDRKKYQDEAPKSMTEADIERIKTQRGLIVAELAKANALPESTDQQKRDKKAAIKKWADAQTNLNNRYASVLTQGRSVAGAGGTTITEGMAPQYLESLNPLSVQGATDVYTSGAKEGAVSWDMADIGRKIIDDARPGFPQTGVRKPAQLDQGVTALQNRLRDIQQVAIDKMGDEAPNVWDLPVTFRYIDYGTGSLLTTTMSIRDAVDSASYVSQEYQRIISDPNSTPEQKETAKKNMQKYHQVLSGSWVVPFTGDSEPVTFSASKNLEYLGRTPELIQPVPAASARIEGTRTIQALEKQQQAAPIDVTRPAAGTRPPPTAPKTSWFPGWNKGNSQAGMPSKIKVNSSFKLSDLIDVTNGPVFTFTVDKYSPSKTNSTVASDMGMALGRDDGFLTPEGRRAVSDSIKKINQAMIAKTPEGKKARAYYSTMVYKALQGASGDGISLSLTGFVDMLEDILGATNEYAATTLIRKFLSGTGLDDYKRYAGTDVATKINATDAAIPNNKYVDSVSGKQVLWHQLRAAVYDLANLYKNAGLSNSSETTGTARSSNFNGVQPTVTWFVDWTQPSGQGGDVQSALTVPAASYNTSMAPVMDKNAAQGQNALSNPLDPTIPRVIAQSSQQILLEADQLVSTLMNQNALEPFMTEAKKGWDQNVGVYGGNAWRNSADWRKESEDGNTEFDTASKNSVAKVFIGGNVLHNLFPAYRIRGSR